MRILARLWHLAGFGGNNAPPTRQRHWEMLAAAGFISVAAACMQVLPDQHVALAYLPTWVVPPTCPMHAMLGIPCPGCGLTRSIILLAHGNLGGSLEMNRMGLIFGLAILAQFPYRIAALARPGRTILSRPWTKGIAAALIAGLVINWLLAISIWPQRDELAPVAKAPHVQVQPTGSP